LKTIVIYSNNLYLDNKNFHEEKAYRMIENGQKFLHEYFAKNMMSLIKEVDDNS